MAKRRKVGKKGGSLVVDFSKIDRSSRRVWVPDGEYLVEVESVKEEIGQESGKPYLIWTLKIVEPKEYDNLEGPDKVRLAGPSRLSNPKSTPARGSGTPPPSKNTHSGTSLLLSKHSAGRFPRVNSTSLPSPNSKAFGWV